MGIISDKTDSCITIRIQMKQDFSVLKNQAETVVLKKLISV